MSARILDGKMIAAAIREEVAAETRLFFAAHGVTPHLAAVLAGDNPASHVYVRNKRAACERAGLASSLAILSADASQAELLGTLARLNADPFVHGILVQLPLPNQIDEHAIVQAIDPQKDVDGLHPTNVGLLAEGRPRFLPCTPAGVQQILIRERIEIRRSHVVIVGRSNLVGKPLAMMLVQKADCADATVTVCHSRTRDLVEHTRRADILVAAMGQPEFVTGAMIRRGAVVIDVGINRRSDGQLVGDVHFQSACEVADAITPVPGGVGPMTVAMLLHNTLQAAKLSMAAG